MTIESCAENFEDSSLVKEVDPVISFASMTERIYDLTDGKSRRVCFDIGKEEDFIAIRSTNQQIASSLGENIQIAPLIEQNGMLSANVPMDTVSASTLKEGYNGEGRGAMLIETINKHTQESPRIRDLINHCWGIDNYSDQFVVYIPIGNRE